MSAKRSAEGAASAAKAQRTLLGYLRPPPRAPAAPAAAAAAAAAAPVAAAPAAAAAAAAIPAAAAAAAATAAPAAPAAAAPAFDLLALLDDDALDLVVAHLDLGALPAAARAGGRLLRAVARAVEAGAASAGAPLNAEQTDAVLRFLLGQSFFLTGLGGSGKSFVVGAVVRVAVAAFGERGVAVCASTSAAANQLSCADVQATTLHSLLRAHKDTDAAGRAVFRPDPCWKQLKDIRLVVVDEVSMVEADLLQALAGALAEAGRRRDCGFAQIICTGDLLQLPNVGGEPVFASAAFRRLPAVELRVNMRAGGAGAEAAHFRSVLGRLRLGAATAADELWLRAHSRQETVNDCGLFSKNSRVRELNERNFGRLRSPVQTCTAKDELLTRVWSRDASGGLHPPPRRAPGDDEEERREFRDDMNAAMLLSLGAGSLEAERAGVSAPPLTPVEREALRPPPESEVKREVRLRVGTRAVLTRAIWTPYYLTEKGARRRDLVAANGDVGNVVSIDEGGGGARVVFPARAGSDDGARAVKVWQVAFSRGCKVCPVTLLQRIFIRYQLPLEIGFARTAHKAQGSSLERPTHVDCVDVFFKGGKVPESLIYTIVSRARSVAQLQFARDRHGKVLDVKFARPPKDALAYHTLVTSKYKPLAAAVVAADLRGA